LPGGCRKLYNEEFHKVYTSLNIVITIKLRRIWPEHVSRTGRTRKAYRILVGTPEGRRPLVSLDVGGRIILK
jgi:hypothetical protein